MKDFENNPLLNSKKTLQVVERILSRNDMEANRLREIWKSKNLYVVNLMSSPGSGKTTLLENLAKYADFKFGVIEGDLETSRDAERLERAGVRAHQITTGTACHLEAKMVSKALDSFSLDGLDILFIENVGNLVCPASYDLGAHINIGLLSVPEGDDKVLKYPTMFRCIDLLLLTKWDIKEHFEYDYERIAGDYKKLKPQGEIMTLNSKSKESLQWFIEWLKKRKSENYTSGHIFE